MVQKALSVDPEVRNAHPRRRHPSRGGQFTGIFDRRPAQFYRLLDRLSNHFALHCPWRHLDAVSTEAEMRAADQLSHCVQLRPNLVTRKLSVAGSALVMCAPVSHAFLLWLA